MRPLLDKNLPSRTIDGEYFPGLNQFFWHPDSSLALEWLQVDMKETTGVFKVVVMDR